MIVVDASVATKWYIDEPDCDAARSLIGATSDCIAPDLILAEFANVAWKRLSWHEISEEQRRPWSTTCPACFSKSCPAWPCASVP